MKLEHMTINDLREIKIMLEDLLGHSHERIHPGSEVLIPLHYQIDLIDKEIAAHNRRTIIGD